MSKYTQSFWRLFCFSFAKKMTKNTFRSAFFMGNQLTTENAEKALPSHSGGRRESEEREHRDALRAWEFRKLVTERSRSAQLIFRNTQSRVFPFGSDARAFRLRSTTFNVRLHSMTLCYYLIIR